MKNLLLGRFKSGLYYFEEENNSQVMLATTKPSSTDSSTIKLWHLRMGHLPVNKLHHINPIFTSSCTLDHFCQICPSAKQSRQSFPVSSIKSTKSLQLLHLDVWGPYKEATYNGCKYFYTIVDDFSKMTWVFLLTHKSDVVQSFMNFIIHVEKQYRLSVQTVRTDNAPELCAGTLKDFYQ